MFSIYHSSRNWESTLLCETVYIHTDHKSLEFFRNTKHNSLGIRIINIIQYLSRFNLKIIYLPGSDKKIAPADLLSRAPYFSIQSKSEESEPKDSDELHNFTINNVSKIFPFTLKHFEELQINDEKISKLRADPKEPYFLRDNLLYRKIKNQDVLVIPTSFVPEIVSHTHFSKGHLSGAKLHKFLRMHFSAPKLRYHCLNVAKFCNDCISVKYVPKMPIFGPSLPDCEE